MIHEVTLSQTNAHLHEKIRTANKVDPFYVEILKKVQEDRLFQQQKEYKVDDSRLLWSKDRLYVPDGGDIRSSILTELHRAPEISKDDICHQETLFLAQVKGRHCNFYCEMSGMLAI